MADDESFTMDEDGGTIPLDLLTGDTDPENDTLSVKSINGTDITPGIPQIIGVDNGTVTVGADGSVSFTPTPDYNGPITFDYVVQDGNGGEDTGTVTGTVNPVNEPPVADDESFTMDEDGGTLTLDLLTGDTDPDNDTLSVKSINGTDITPGIPQTIGVDNGTVSVGADGSVSFTPTPDYNGPITFDYVVEDGNGGEDTGTVTGTVNPVNEPPVVNSSAITVDEASQDTGLGLTAPTDADGDTLTITVTGLPTLGQVTKADGTVVNNGDTLTSEELQGLLYDAPADYNGTDDPGDFTYNVSDGTTTVSGSTDISITTVNDLPTLDLDGNDSSGATGNDYTTTFTEGGSGVAIGDSDVVITDLDDTNIESATIILTNRLDGDTVESLSVNGTLPTGITASSYDSATGTITLTGSATLADYQTAIAQIEYNNTSTNPNTTARSVTVVVNDGDSDSNTATTTIGIIATNSSPVVNSSAITVDETSQNTGLGLTTPTDADGDTLTITVTGLPTLGQVTKADGTVVNNGDTLTSEELQGLLYDAPADYNGTDDPGDFTYNVSDGTETVSGSTDITINPINDPPVADDETFSTTQGDGAITLDLLTGDTDPDGDDSNLSVKSINGIDLTPGTTQTITVPNGTVNVAADGSITFTPDADYTGDISFDYIVEDEDGLTDTGTVSGTVSSEPEVNQAPIANNDNGTTFVDQPVTFNITDNDSDIDGNINPDTIDLDPDTPGNQKTTTVPEGTFTLDDDGNLTFTPEASFVGEVTIPYTVADNNNQTSNQANITVEVVNTPPIATDDNASSEVGVPVTLNIVNNDIDNENDIDPSTIDLDPNTPDIQKTLTVPGAGTFTVDEEGNVTFTPVDEFVGEVNIPYTVADNNGSTSEIANINVGITPEVPFAIDDNANTTVNTPVSFNITDNDIAGEETQIAPATIDLDPSIPEPEKTFTVEEGNFTVDETGEVTFTPTDGFVGEVTIPYTVEDIVGNITNQGQITVEVINSPPIATDDNASTSVNQPVTFNIANNDLDQEGEVDPSTIDLDPSTPDIEKILEVAGQGIFNVDENGELTFTPELEFAGEVTIPYTIADENNNVSNPANVTVTVVNLPPIATDNSESTTAGQAVTFNITDDDSDPDTTLDLTTVDLDPSTPERDTSITVPGEGSYTVDDAGNVTFTPEAGFSGVTTPITYTIQDNLGAVSNQANISIEVTETGQLEGDSTTTPPNTPVTFSIIDNDENIDPTTIDLDPETNGIQKTITVPGEGTFTVDDEGNVTFTPVDGFEGEASIPYAADDNDGNPLEPADISVNVEPTPELTDDTTTTPPNTPVTFSIIDNDENIDPTTIDLDPETNGIQKTITVPGKGTFTVDDDGNVTFTPVDGFEGEASIPYAADDNDGNPLAPADISVNVEPTPELTDDTTTTPPNTPVTFSIIDNDENIDPSTIDLDPETDGIQKTITVPNQGTFTVDDDGNVTFTPVDGFEGEASIPYAADDNDGNPLAPADISVNVEPTPELTDDTTTTPPNTPVTFSIIDNDENIDPTTIDLDPETNGIQKTITVPGKGTFTVDDDGNVTFTPVDGFEGEASIPYAADDNDGNPLAPADISVNVEPT
ncbi:MAG: tandem-95 repeat protein, partial [Okeania sp. SIO3I5]|nr:tandem-95 repeat protein [Okeania sp. SIO3I5]